MSRPFLGFQKNKKYKKNHGYKGKWHHKTCAPLSRQTDSGKFNKKEQS
jgi:hypothetical protein